MRPTDRLRAAAVTYACLGYLVLPLHHPIPYSATAPPRDQRCAARVATRPVGQSASIP